MNFKCRQILDLLNQIIPNLNERYWNKLLIVSVWRLCKLVITFTNAGSCFRSDFLPCNVEESRSNENLNIFCDCPVCSCTFYLCMRIILVEYLWPYGLAVSLRSGYVNAHPSAIEFWISWFLPPFFELHPSTIVPRFYNNYAWINVTCH